MSNQYNALGMEHGNSDEKTTASWHPALRPNDDHHSGSNPIQPLSRAAIDVESHSANPPPDFISRRSSDEQLQSFPDPLEKASQDVHPGLSSPPSEPDPQGPQIPEPKLSREGGAQAFQQPAPSEDSGQGESLHNEDSGHGQFNILKPETSGPVDGSTGDFGLSLGEGRTQHSRHEEKSEISSDDDEERLDPAWGISRSGTQQVLGQIQRSSSFPASSFDATLEESAALNRLPHTQSEAGLAPVETDEIPDTGVQEPVKRSEQAASWISTSNGVVSDAQEDSFFEEMASRNESLKEPTSAEARFEEGLPLIDSESKPNDEAQEQQMAIQPVSDILWSTSGNEKEATLSDDPTTINSEVATNPGRLNLDRKATSDVLKSLNYSSHPFPKSLTAGEERSPDETQQPHDGQTQEKTLGGNANGGADISAMWEAVLDDDDFLAEDSDGLLPDSSPESSPDSPSSFLGSLNDGTGFQEPDEILSRYDSRSSRGGSVAATTDQGRQTASRQTSNPYAPHQPSSSDLTQMSPTTYGNVGITRPNLAPMSFGQNSFQGQFQRPPAPSKAESFVDQSKGGYKSPYDLPMDLSKPRKRVQMHQPPPASTGPAPPPRSSSMTSDQRPVSSAGPLQSPFSPANATFEGQARPPSSHNSAGSQSLPTNRRVSNEQPNDLKAKASSSSFFEELPITARPRPPTAQGRYTPAQSGVFPPQISVPSPPTHQLQAPTQMPPPPVPTKQSSIDSYSQYQLQRPERLDPYANVPLQPSATPVVPSTRYSPAPPTSQTAPPPSRYSPAPPSSQIAPPLSAPSRYSPAPPPQSTVMQTQNRYASQPQPSPQLPPHNTMPQSRHPFQPPPPVPNALPFQPRTSSPLAYQGKKSGSQVDDLHAFTEGTPTSPPTRAPPPQHVPPQIGSPSSSGPPIVGQGFAPPQRSQTQSPGKRGPVSSLIATSIDTMQRPASVHGSSSPITSPNAYQSFPPARPSIRQRGLSQHLSFIAPTDESQHDELQRWRGSPIFRFGLGGSVLSSFPKHVPRYAGGSTTQMIKSIPGEVQIRNAKEIFSTPEHVAMFPGPLRSKAKKKEVLAWLSARIKGLEIIQLPSFSQQLPDPTKRHDERVLLWKVVRAIVEHDGVVDGSAEVQRAMNMVLSPESISLQALPSMHSPVGSDVAGIYKPAGAISNTQVTDPAAVESVRKGLLRGEREKAVWTAVDNRLWAHAMLLSSTLDKSVWKQVAHEFVRQEVKLIGANTEPLAALYEIFAGNLEESIDELVPLSARAGLQMVSKVGGTGPTKSALDGLDRWKETLGLVLNNRSPEDQKALAALGRLLSSYGRIEASHICHLFAISPMLPSIFGGADDPHASIVLLGADHRNQPNEFFFNEDAILLTEVYEFATSILASSSKSALMPHLQAYKLQRVRSLAEAGFKTEAQAYCDAMGASLRSTTKLSPYYHPQFLAELDELTQCLSQAPTETSSWISKPTMGKVSDSVWNKFTTFVAGGDESDAASNGSGREAGHEFGPFAKAPGTPNMSRPGSSSDLYGSYSSAAPQPVPNTIAASRYGPSGQYSARSSAELTRGRPSLDSQRTPSYMPQGQSQAAMQRSPYDPNAPTNQQSYMSPPIPTQSSSPYAHFSASPPVQPQQATPPQASYMPAVHSEDPVSSHKSRLPESYVPSPPPEQAEHYMPTIPPTTTAPSFDAESTHIPPFDSYSSDPRAAHQSTSTYAPPLQSYGSYEPPSTEYVPFQPDPSSDSESETRRPEKNPVMDDDGNFPSSTFSQPNNISASTDDTAASAARKKANDTATEAAFRAAAEADAAKDKPSINQDKTLKAKPSWFGSLWSRKESDSLDSNPTKGSGSGSGGGDGQKVIRAKLGEESSFYYDKELKKWVNKKDPGSMQQSVKATPPPPKGPVGRVVSESLGSPGAGVVGPPRSGLTAPPPSLSSSRPGSSNGPPSRDGTPGLQSVPIPAAAMGESSAASLSAGQDFIAAAVPTSGPASTASDIDDLLGGPPTAGGRKPGGTLKGKKGRGRYVDIMAK